MHYNRKDDRIELSVRELCGLALRGGSLDNRFPPVSLYDRAAEGRELHKKLQVNRGAGYYPEVTLSNVCRLGDITFCVSGRADGVIYDAEGGCTVEEIKSVTGRDAYIHAPRQADLAQLSCYGYFLSCTKGLSTVTLRLTYAKAGEEEEAEHMDSIMTAEHLKAAYVSMLAVILPRAQDLRERETVIRAEAKQAVFPYADMREAQVDMIRECWRDLRHGETVFAQAPTGIGKTISTLYPSVRCLGEHRCDKIFYLTAKSATRREVVGAVEKMIAAGTHLRAVVISSRESACACDVAKDGGGRLSRFCNPDACPYAKGYYDRVEGVIQKLLNQGNSVFTYAELRKAAAEGCVCPYELSLDLSERCEIVICDYNYIFSPSVYLRRYFADGIAGSEGHRYIFLVDEAHNLADRARDMYSGTLSLSYVIEAQDALNAYETALISARAGALFPDEDDPVEDARNRVTAASLDDLVGELTRMAGVCRESLTEGTDGVKRGADLSRRPPVTLLEEVHTLTRKCDLWLRRNPSHPVYAAVDVLSARLHGFGTAGDYYDERFSTLVEVEGEEVRVSLNCLDPSGILGPILKKAVSRVLFSATLTPADYFADILGGGRNSICVAFDSPFPPENLCVVLGDKVSTRFEDRDKSYRRVVSYIAATVAARKGNYMVYFPSYDYLEKVRELFVQKYPKVRLLVQQPQMSAADREAFIHAFVERSDKLQIGFCVLGGSFSEGVDLPGNSLIGVIVVGVGLPGLSSQRNVIKEYYDETREGEGYAYAYTYPGMNRVLQAAGRVIRRPEDKGVVVLLDDRYAAPPYLGLYPDHWQSMTAAGDPASLSAHLARFWERVDGEDET